MCKIAVVSRCRPDHVDTEVFVAARARIAEAYKRRGAPEAGRNVRAVLHRLQLTLFHATKIDSLTRPASKPSVTVSGWAPIPQLYRDNAHRYIEQVRVSLSPSSVKHIEQHLRVFGTWLAEHHGGIRSCAELERDHIEDFKIWISTTPSARTGKPLARTSVKEQLINLGCFFERTTNWGYPNAPTRPLLFAGDLLRIDRPLPRFLDDAAAAKLARATRTEPDPLTRLGVANALARIANNAGIGHVTPHQLRHTLATQAINRPMSLEAIAALLGHKTLAMTMVYARIADKTVADEYFAVTDKVEALYNQPHQLPASDEGNEMRKLRAEMHRRMLGNGYCARPVEMDCHFESICESCNFFVTTIEFKPTLRRLQPPPQSRTEEIRSAGGPSPVRVEGKEEREWVLLDYGAFVVHVFHTDQRDFYQLERLWGDRPRLDWTPASPSRPETQVWQP